VGALSNSPGMYTKHLTNTFTTLLGLLLLLPLPGTYVQADDNSNPVADDPYILVQAEASRSQVIEVVSPPAGSAIPDAASQSNAKEKKCMTVCARWGEDCTYTDRGIGGTSRSCRRTCQQFTEECF